MATDLNKVILIGRLTRDPEFKNINSTSLTNFSIANNRSYTANNEKKDETSFFDCEVWGKLAEVMRDYGKKGKQIALEGRLTQSTWESPDGKKNSKIRIRVDTFQFLGNNTTGGAAPNSQNQPSSKQTNNEPVYEETQDYNYPEDDIF
jgi:single-strand DNA-binding protein